MIVRSVDLGGIDDHYCLEVIVRFVDLEGIDDICKHLLILSSFMAYHLV